jgi:hypothetical protein
MPMSDIFRTYKLSSGDDIIGKVIGKNTKYIVINRPFSIRTVTAPGPREFVMFKAWDILTDEIEFELPLHHIISESSPKPEVVQMYLSELDKQDVINDLKDEIMNDPRKLDEFIKSQIEQDLNEPMSDSEVLPYEENMLDEEDVEETANEDNVMMNFIVPPALFMSFLLNGIVSFDPETKEHEFDIESFYRDAKRKWKNNPNKDTEKDSPDDEINKQFRDWNPEP